MTHPENVQKILDKIRLRTEEAQEGIISLTVLELCLRGYADQLMTEEEE